MRGDLAHAFWMGTTLFATWLLLSGIFQPLFSGFVTKSMTLTAVAEDGHWITWTILLLASTGVLLHTAIKISYTAFFSKDSGKRVKEAPLNMLVAMGLTAVLCVFIGVYPNALYTVLPNPVNYVP